MSEKITITDLAKRLNTTPATISRALSDHPAISEGMKRKVRLLADKLHYKRNQIASSLRSGKSFTIGVLIPSADINFFGSVVHGIDNVANANGYHTLLYQTNENHKSEAEGIDALLSAHVDGILISIAKETQEYAHLDSAQNAGVPIVFFDRSKSGLGIPAVTIDDYKGAYQATEHLIREGYSKIAHIAGPQHIKAFSDRYKGYLEALQNHHLPIQKNWFYEGNVSIQSGRKAIELFLQESRRPDAVFAVEDYTALGAIKELKARGIKIPQQFGVFGFANELFAEHITPSLSSVDQQTVTMGRESMKLLLSLMQENKTSAEVKDIVLKPKLLFRDSSNKKIK